jgi:MinD-like ATPase involved in chromosome partitioning or flagellar assembly
MAKVISLHSFRGGTGKSNITANLATVMAEAGHRVGMVDTDIQSPGIHAIFGLSESDIDVTLNAFLWGQKDITDAAYDVSRPASLENGELYLVPSSMKLADISRVLHEGYDVRLLKDGLKDLVRSLELDYLFLDTHPGLNEETLLSIAICGVLVIVLRPDSQDYQGTGVTLEIARKLGVPDIYLVLNKALPEIHPDDYCRTLSLTYETEVGAVLPLSVEVARAASGGVFCQESPEHAFSQGIRDLAKRLLAVE